MAPVPSEEREARGARLRIQLSIVIFSANGRCYYPYIVASFGYIINIQRNTDIWKFGYSKQIFQVPTHNLCLYHIIIRNIYHIYHFILFHLTRNIYI